MTKGRTKLPPDHVYKGVSPSRDLNRTVQCCQCTRRFKTIEDAAEHERTYHRKLLSNHRKLLSEQREPPPRSLEIALRRCLQTGGP
jgi:hypothetical protein